MDSVAVIGSNSFSGSVFVEEMMRAGKRVVCISRSPEKSAAFCRYLALGRPEFHRLDLNHHTDEIMAVLDATRPDAVVSFAAQSMVGQSWDTPWDWFQTNGVGMARLIHAMARRDWLERYIHISTPEIYGSCTGSVTEDAPLDPSTPYAASKAACDLNLMAWHKSRGFPVSFVRSTNVYGAGQQLYRIIPRTFTALRSGRPLTLDGGGVAVKSYLHMRDVARGILAVAERGRAGEVYHLSPDGEPPSIRQLVAQIVEIEGAAFDDVVRVGPERPGQDAFYLLDSTKARTELGWAPSVDLRRGLAEVSEWVGAWWDELRTAPTDYAHLP